MRDASFRRIVPPSHASGFTLIELLVVIAVVALLTAILVPALHRARKQAREVACRANLKQWATVFAVYLEGNEGHFPRGWVNDPLWFLSERRLDESEMDPNQFSRVYTVRADRIACCPMAVKPTGAPGGVSKAGDRVYLQVNAGSVFGAWEITYPPPLARGSYGLNSNIFTWQFEGRGIVPPTLLFTDAFNQRNIGSAMPLLFDCTQPSNRLIHERFRPPTTEPTGLGGDVCINRHNACLNMLFFDSSVRKVGLKELWTLKWDKRFITDGPWTKAGGVKPEDWPEWMQQFKDY